MYAQYSVSTVCFYVLYQIRTSKYHLMYDTYNGNVPKSVDLVKVVVREFLFGGWRMVADGGSLIPLDTC